MDKRFLHKVLNQLVRETRIDYDMGEIQFPFGSSSLLASPFYRPRLLLVVFSRLYSEYSKHCRDVYGLNEEETDYVWKEYKQIIKDKIDNNG
tara:strand:- start:187 stop:462 length:276 start_codon:yes stop_codon:yes gene_type:complete